MLIAASKAGNKLLHRFGVKAIHAIKYFMNIIPDEEYESSGFQRRLVREKSIQVSEHISPQSSGSRNKRSTKRAVSGWQVFGLAASWERNCQ
jgi:hypothetical protein